MQNFYYNLGLRYLKIKLERNIFLKKGKPLYKHLAGPLYHKVKSMLYLLNWSKKIVFAPLPLYNFQDYNKYWMLAGRNWGYKRGEFLCPFIKKGTSVLDLGCGDGGLLQTLRENNKCSVFGYDISNVAIERARNAGIPCKIVDILSEDFLLTEQFDYIIMTDVLEHIREPEKIMPKLKDKFRDNLIISIPNFGFCLQRLRYMCGRFPTSFVQFHIREHLRFWTIQEFQKWVGVFGYKVESIKTIYGPPKREQFHCGFFARHFPSLFGVQIAFFLK